MKTMIFEVGKTYYSQTRGGRVKPFKVTDVLRRKSTGERVFVVGSYDGKVEQRYRIHNAGSDEWIDVDSRYCTVVDTHELSSFNNVSREDL